MSDQGWSPTKVSLMKTHAGYVLFILICLLIGLLTVKWADVPKLPEYIGFALTLASLLLALLAIGYSIHSTRGMETNFGQLVSSISNVREIASSLAGSTQLLNTEFRILSDKTGNIETRMGELSERKSTPPKQMEDKKGEEKVHPQQSLTDFMKRCSINGRILLYIAGVSFLNKKMIDGIELCQTAKLEQDYFHGFLVACVCANRLRSDSTSFKKLHVLQFPDMSADMLKIVESELYAHAARAKSKGMKEAIENDMLAIKTYLRSKDFDLFESSST